MTRRTCLLLGAMLVGACTPEEATETTPETPTVATQSADPFAPSSDIEAEVVAVVQALFDALETGDEELLRHVLHPSVVMHWSEHRDGSTTFGSADVDGLSARITSSEVPLIERMWDPTVRVHGALASVWTEYDFYAGPDFSHCGVDAVNLLRGDEGWRIVALSWTRAQPPECSLHPSGPPS